jgi:Maltokinase N-terminal cap domain
MAVIHHTTMSPTKLELLSGWLPGQAWFDGPADRLVRAGGFRLDDPAGEVGIELMVVGTGDAAYLVPMTYRGAPLEGADHALIGTAQHGVLGDRWIYDGEHDPVLRTQLAALLSGTVVAQAQGESHTADPTVQVRPVAGVATVELRRLLTEDEMPAQTGSVSAQWSRPDGSMARGIVATAGRQPAVPLRT